jgi:DnaJ-class molecular chaperone
MIDFSTIDKSRKLLGLPDSATLEEIKSAYRGMALQYHPDTCADKDKKQCEAMFKKITKARDVLLKYCMAYRYSFREEEVKQNTLDDIRYAEHMSRFYDEWMQHP